MDVFIGSFALIVSAAVILGIVRGHVEPFHGEKVVCLLLIAAAVCFK